MKDINRIKILPTSTIKEALNIIDTGAIKIAIVVDQDDTLLGTITDGDIRRAILKGMSLDDPISEIYFKTPIVVSPTESKERIINLCISKNIYQIPVVDGDGKVIGIEILDDLLKPKMYPNKVVLMVGGLGSRLRPLTNDCPKPMLFIGNKPILHIIVERFASCGFHDIVMCVNYKAYMIKEYFGDGTDFNASIKYIEEEEPLGTAGALALLKNEIDMPFFVMNGDVLTNINFEQLLEFHLENRANITMCVKDYEIQVPYGVVSLKSGRLCALSEKPIYKFFINAGIYVLTPDCLDYIGENQFYDMAMLINTLISCKKRVIPFPIREYWLDIGRIEDYEKATKEYLENYNDNL